MAALRPVRGYGRASGADETAHVKLHFMPAPDPQPKCPTCGQLLVKRCGRHGHFYGCAGYPRCRVTFPVTLIQESIRRQKEKRASVGR